jgi:uncharacterized membrane protein
MNDAHLHMIVNHFPIIGTIFGLGVLVAGLVLKNNTIKNTAYCLFIVCAVFAFSSMYTGEGAEEIAEKLPSVTDQVIHEHEEMAEKLAFSLYALGLISIAGLYMNTKKHSKANLVSFFAMTVAAVAVFLAQQTGTTGGEIRHTEIRANATNVTNSEQTGAENKEGDDD